MKFNVWSAQFKLQGVQLKVLSLVLWIQDTWASYIDFSLKPYSSLDLHTKSAQTLIPILPRGICSVKAKP